MDVLRAALGERTLTYFGASYGTKLGATYAELFPEQVGRFVLDGAVDLSLDARELSLEQAAGFETALRAYVENCVGRPPTPASSATPSTRGSPGSSSSSTTSTPAPLPTSSDRELEVGNAFYGIVAPLYVRDYWFLLSAALKDGLRRATGSHLLELSDLYTSRGDRRLHRQQRRGDLRDQLPRRPVVDPAPVAGAEPSARSSRRPRRRSATSSPGGSPAAPDGRCESDRGAARTSRPPGRAPIVVVGTTRDPATPYAWAEALADQLDVRRARQPRRRRPHRLQPRQRLRRRGGRGLPGRRHRPRRRPHLLTLSGLRSSHAGLTCRGPQRGVERLGDRLDPRGWPARSSAARRARAWRRPGARSRGCRTARGRSDTQPASGASRGSSCSAAPAGDDRVGQPHADQLDGGLDVLDLDPGLRVPARSRAASGAARSAWSRRRARWSPASRATPARAGGR